MHSALAARHRLHFFEALSRIHRIFWPWQRSHAVRFTAPVEGVVICLGVELVMGLRLELEVGAIICFVLGVWIYKC